jgi:hypothetical protein
MRACIFCFDHGADLILSDEHVIPASLEGELVLSDSVCKRCNDRFGFEIDHAILKNQEILAAKEKLGLTGDRPKLINHNFKISGESPDIRLRGRATDSGFEFPPQALADGSFVHPESDFKEALLKRVLRDQRLYDAGLSTGQIVEEYERLLEAHEKAVVGERIEWPTLGCTLVKRSETLQIKLQAKGDADVKRLVAKIAYEFGFVVGDREFLLAESVSQPLNQLVMTGEGQAGVHISPFATSFSDYAPLHFLRMQMYDFMTRLAVVFYGRIAYNVIAPLPDRSVLARFADHYDCPGVVGVEFQQDVANARVGFWALLPDDNVKYIGP